MSDYRKPKGMYTILPLPFTENFEIKEDVLLEAIDWAVGAGARGIVATGSVGEFSHLDREERLRVMEVSLARIRQHAGVDAIAMTAAAGTLETIYYTKYAKELGYDYVLIVPPFYWRVGEEEVWRHFRMISEAVKIPIIVYHNAVTSKFDISVKFARRLAEIPEIVGMKEMKHDMAFLMSLYGALSTKLSLMQTFRVYLQALLMGAAGGSITCFALPACVRITELFEQGELAKAMKIQQALNELFKGSTEGAGVLGRIKTACSLTSGLDFGPPRPPYLAPGKEEMAILQANFDRLTDAMVSSK
ncbi:MAG: dihydrodipicolinate synthase family protein [Deltaproteobacteria bacterium]|nr:dihydrodipicolinate synthase family protein [Deltaproteobacteria bacterium]